MYYKYPVTAKKFWNCPQKGKTLQNAWPYC